MPSRYIASNQNNDILKNESFARVDFNKANQNFKFFKQVKNCYEGNIRSTLEDLSSMLKNNREDFYYWITIANCYQRNKDYKISNFYLNIAQTKIRNDEMKAVLLNNRAVLKLRQNDSVSALNLLRESIKAAPQLMNARYNLSLLYLSYGLSERASKTLKTLQYNGPKDQTVIFMSAYNDILKGDWKNANKKLATITQMLKQYSNQSLLYSYSLLEAGNVSESQKVLKDFFSSASLTDKHFAKYIQASID